MTDDTDHDGAIDRGITLFKDHDASRTMRGNVFGDDAMNASIFSFWTDRNDPLHYWKLIGAGWFIALLGAFPTLSLTWGSDALWPFAVLAGFPAVAHLYGFLDNITALKTMENHGRVGPGLVGVCYIIAAVLGITQIEFMLAITLPLTGVIMAVLTFGIFFTGFAPLLGMVLVFFLLRYSLTRHNVIFAGVIMTAAWLLSLATGWFLGQL